jgi:F0F1-type ATP synthase delta subunit
MNYSDILRWVKTTDHARDLLSEIEILLENLFKMETNAFEKALRSISILTSQTLKEAFTKDNISFEDKSMIKEYLIGLKEQLQKLKVLKLSLAFEASEYSIDYLFAWVLKNQGVGIVLDIKTDKSIIGGAIIEFNGKYKDFSLRKKLVEVFASRREEIMSNMKILSIKS